MYDNYEHIKILTRRLKNSFVLTGSEVIHIRNFYTVLSTHHFHHSSYLYTEIHLSVDATCYSFRDGHLHKEEIQSLYLTLDNLEVIKATQENVALLMLDDCHLIRGAAQEWYYKLKAS